MNKRVRYLRKELLHMSMENFGKRIGMSESALSRFENGKNGISDIAVSSICHAYHVNEEWLREGKGEIFTDESTNEVVQRLSRLADYSNPNEFQRCVTEMISMLTDEQWRLLSDMTDMFLEIKDREKKTEKNA